MPEISIRISLELTRPAVGMVSELSRCVLVPCWIKVENSWIKVENRYFKLKTVTYCWKYRWDTHRACSGCPQAGLRALQVCSGIEWNKSWKSRIKVEKTGCIFWNRFFGENPRKRNFAQYRVEPISAIKKIGFMLYCTRINCSKTLSDFKFSELKLKHVPNLSWKMETGKFSTFFS